MLRSIAQGLLAVAEWLRGRLAEAERSFAASIAGWRVAGLPTLIAWDCYDLAQVQRAQGRLDAAALTFSRKWKAVSAGSRRPPVRLRGPGRGGLPAGELDLALRHAREGIALCRQLVYTAPMAAAWPRWHGSGRPPVIRPGR